MDRFTWGIVVGVLALVCLGVAAAVVVRTQETPPDLGTPGGVTLAFEQALDRGDAEQAWDLLATSAQTQTTRDRFLARASGLRSRATNSRLSVDDVQVDGETARVDLVRTFTSSGLGPVFDASASTRNTVRLVRENGAWRITVPPEPFLILSGPP